MGEKIGRFRSEEGREAYVRAYHVAMATLPEPAETFDLATSLGTVRSYRWAGNDPRLTPVVLLPGRSSGVPMWAENLPGLLESGRTLIAMDAVGDAGLSVQTAPIRTSAMQARWVDEALEAMGINRANTVGHSFGGATAALHALHHPARVATLTLLEPVFVLRWPPASTFFWATVSILPGPRSWRDHALAAIGGVSVDEVRADSPVGTMISAAAQQFRADLPNPRPLSDDNLARLTMPAYVAIAGDQSLAGGERAAARARHLPHATVQVWPGTTHSLPMQVHEQLAGRLRAFWDANP
ncbi:alpha/beta fold hydrolase [Actinoplanes sp. GCM10030250]|uniref:alpha/beta fold hydrolase n=1 Tax=Actinoplanes sp. GCM10030250 TaxID=3273376 RepID=UPI0036147304